MTLQISILGPMRVTRNEVALNIGSPKQRAVLALLAINANRALTTDAIIDALWDEAPPPSAAATLQAYISNLRRVLEPDRPPRAPAQVIESSGGGYRLAVDADRIDAFRFKTQVATATELMVDDPQSARSELERAIALWKGPALFDFRYESFAQEDIARLDEELVTARELLIAVSLELGLAEELVADIEQLVAAHPLRERPWGQLMLALYRSDRQADALRAYRRCCAALGEVGLAPSASIQQLELAILSRDSKLARPQRPTTRARCLLPVAGEPPRMVGRSDAIATATALLTSATAGQGSVVLVAGEGGIGKSRFLEHVAAKAMEKDFRVALARCVEVGGSPPFWPWRQLAGQLAAVEPELARSHANVFGPDAQWSSNGDPTAKPLHAVANAIDNALAALANDRPLLLAIDDLESADPDSLALLSLVAPAIADKPIVIVASHRPPAYPLEGPLVRLRANLSHLSWLHRIRLASLTRDDLAVLVDEIAGRPVEAEVVDAIYMRTAGNVFFAVELVKLLEQENRLGSADAASVVPQSVIEVIGGRLVSLSESTLDFIRFAAVYGLEFDARTVARAAGIGVAGMAAALEAAIGAALVSPTDRTGMYRFNHRIVVDSITQAIGPIRRAEIHGLIADGLERSNGAAGETSAALAHHRVAARELRGTGPAIEALSRAGDDALAASAFELAGDLLTARLELVRSEPEGAARNGMEVDALLDLARVWTWKEGFHSPQLRHASNRLWELTGIDADAVAFAADVPILATNHVLSSFQARFSVEMVSGDVHGALEVATKMTELATTWPDPMVVFAANQTMLTASVHAGRVAAALNAAAAAEGALDVLDPGRSNVLLLPLGQQPARLTLHAFKAWAHALAGNREASGMELAAARASCQGGPSPLVRGFAATIEGIVAAIEDAPERIPDILEWSEPSQPGELFGLVAKWRNLFRWWAVGARDGQPARAAGEMRELLAELASTGAEVSHSLYWGLVAQLEVSAGNPSAALDAAATGLRRAATRGERFWEPRLQLAMAAALEMQGDGEAAKRHAAAAIAVADELGLSVRDVEATVVG